MLAVIGYMPLIAYQLFVSTTLKSSTSIIIICIAALFLLSIITYVAYLFEKKRLSENSPKLKKLAAKHILLRNRLKNFRAGRIYNKIVIVSGLFAFALGLTIILLGLASTLPANFIQGVNAEAFWMGMIFFFALFSWVAYAKFSIKTIKMLPLIQVLLMFLLIKVGVSSIQGLQAYGENPSNMFYILLITNLILACSLFVLEVIEWIGFLWILCFRRAGLFLPEYSDSIQITLRKQIFLWGKQIVLVVLLVLFWDVLYSAPPSESLFVKVQNETIAYNADNTIILKNIKFN